MSPKSGDLPARDTGKIFRVRGDRLIFQDLALDVIQGRIFIFPYGEGKGRKPL